MLFMRPNINQFGITLYSLASYFEAAVNNDSVIPRKEIAQMAAVMKGKSMAMTMHVKVVLILVTHEFLFHAGYLQEVQCSLSSSNKNKNDDDDDDTFWQIAIIEYPA